MWGSKICFAREFLLKHSAAYGEGTGEGERRGRTKGEGTSKKLFLPMHKSCLRTWGRGDREIVQHRHRERFHFHLKMHWKRWVAESLAVVASRPGKEKSKPQFASPLVSSTISTVINVNCANKLIHHCIVTTLKFPYFDYIVYSCH